MALTRYEKLVQQVVDQVFEDISHTPGGYAYLQQLPKQGRSSQASLRLRWRCKVMEVVLPLRLHNAMVKAALTPEGKVDTRGVALVTWLLDTLYVTPTRLYNVWATYHAPPVVTPRKERIQHHARS